MSNTQTIDVLNDVTKSMIDSVKGYQACCELADESFALQTEFGRRKSEREQLVQQLQGTVRTFGGEPETDGTASGTVHRAFTQFSSYFQDDVKAAVSAIDDGEEHLAEKIEDKLNDNDLPAQAVALLQRAHASAKAGESYADMIEDHL